MKITSMFTKIKNYNKYDAKLFLFFILSHFKKIRLVPVVRSGNIASLELHRILPTASQPAAAAPLYCGEGGIAPCPC